MPKNFPYTVYMLTPDNLVKGIRFCSLSAALYHQQWIEYAIGMSAWIVRKN